MRFRVIRREPRGGGRRRTNATLLRGPHGATQTITPATIPSAIAWFPAVVAGPLGVSTIASAENWFVPTVNSQQVIRPSTIASGETWFSPRVGNVQTIAPATIPTAEHWGTPVVRGGKQYIAVSTIASSERWFPPTVTGGDLSMRLFMSGVDQTRYLFKGDGDHNLMQITSQTLGRWQCTFDLVVTDGSFVPVLGQTVLVVDWGRRLFGGCISEWIWDRSLSTVENNTFHITCTDKAGICDHRVVTGATFKAGDDIATILATINSTWLNGEGFSTAGIPADGSLGTLAADITANFQTVTNVFDQICNDNGLVWWVDSFSTIYVSPLATLPAAPFTLGEATSNYRASQSSGSGSGNLTSKQTTQNFYNKLYAVSNLNIIPGGNGGAGDAGAIGNVETFTLTVGQPGVQQQTDPSGVPAGIIVSAGIGSIIGMTVNGHAQSVYDFVNDFKGQTSSGPNDYLWVYAAGYPFLSWTFEPPAGSSIVITYVPGVPAQNSSVAQYGQAIVPLNPSGQPLGTCGSGIYEGVIQVHDVSSQDDLNAIAAAELARIGGVPIVVDYQTDWAGLAPGQLQAIDIPLSGVSNKHLLITKLSGTYIADGVMGQGTSYQGSFRWDVECTTNLDPGNATKWFERILKRTTNPLPVLQYEVATWVLAPGGAIASAIAATNPYPVERTGLAVECQWSWAQAPVDQDLIVTVTRNNQVVVSAVLNQNVGPNLNTLVPIPGANNLYFFKGDILNINVSYSVTGTRPSAAGGLTFKVRWAM